MKLYKYVSRKALIEILRTNRMGFSYPTDLNDPFDLPTVVRPEPYEMFNIFGGITTSEDDAKDSDTYWRKHAVASFTRTHDNPLMWAHYADSHKGAVIEIDGARAGLTNKGFVIPAQFGSVIYMKRPNLTKYPIMQPSASVHSDEYKLENYEQLQRLFLTKPICWAYEEEVRVVYRAQSLLEFGGFICHDDTWIFKHDPKTMFCYNLRQNSITNVYLGVKFEESLEVKRLSESMGFNLLSTITPPESYELTFEIMT